MIKLSNRQLQICRYLAEGKNNNEIAALLFLSKHTIKSHVSAIIANIGAVNRTHAAYILAKENIINV